MKHDREVNDVEGSVVLSRAAEELVSLYSRLGRMTEARAEFERALALVPGFPAAVANLKLLQQTVGQAKSH